LKNENGAMRGEQRGGETQGGRDFVRKRRNEGNQGLHLPLSIELGWGTGFVKGHEILKRKNRWGKRRKSEWNVYVHETKKGVSERWRQKNPPRAIRGSFWEEKPRSWEVRGGQGSKLLLDLVASVGRCRSSRGPAGGNGDCGGNKRAGFFYLRGR